MSPSPLLAAAALSLLAIVPSASAQTAPPAAEAKVKTKTLAIVLFPVLPVHPIHVLEVVNFHRGWTSHPGTITRDAHDLVTHCCVLQRLPDMIRRDVMGNKK